ncbi:MAG: hypothetical protein H8Z69_01315 [Nanohaloarchaea archaeon]|nr:hypothetical protein [Candidatus Nanohaloarchaea archaeon]
MSWHATDAIDETVEKTKDFLMPFDLGLWSRLALVVFFVGSISLSVPLPPLPPEAFMALTEISGIGVSAAFIAGIIAVSFIIGLGMLFLSSVFNFVLFQGLIEENFDLGSLFSQNIGRGIQFMSFQLVALLAGIIFLAGTFALAFVQPLFLIPAVIVLIPLAVISGIVMTLVHDFVLPEMIKKDTNLITSLKSVYPDLKDQSFEVLIYVVLKIAISLAVGFAVSFGSIAAIILLAVVLGIPAAILSMIGIPVGGIAIMLGLIGFVILMVFIVAVPVNVFMYFYALNVYEKLLE